MKGTAAEISLFNKLTSDNRYIITAVFAKKQGQL